MLSTRKKILSAVESEHNWVGHFRWNYRYVIILYFEKGIEYTIDYVEKNSNKFRKIKLNKLKEELLSIQRD